MGKKLTEVRSHVRGPFLEYECSSCGTTVQENAPTNRERLVDRIVAANSDASTRVCASCWQPAGRSALAEEERG